MNCRECENLLAELACDRLTDAVARKRALVHAAVCADCARRLTTQRALTADLFELALETGRQHAPARVKEYLQAALAERRAMPAATQPSATVLAFKPNKPTIRWRWALAAAASILALSTLTALWLGRYTAPAPRHFAGQPGVLPAPSLPAPTPGAQPVAERQRARRNQPRRPRTPAATEQELASEFVPLTLATNERALNNGTLVRLEVPRARLIAMGLPLRVEGERDTINAEVMLGDDGVAYAIRVLR